MAASSAPKVKKALLELLQANAELAGVQISYGHPGAQIQQEAIYFHRTIEQEVAAALGHRRRDEDYTVELVVDVVQDGQDVQAPEERCWALVAVVENIVRENAAMAEVSGWVVFAGAEMGPVYYESQILAEAVCKIHVKHRK